MRQRVEEEENDEEENDEKGTKATAAAAAPGREQAGQSALILLLVPFCKLECLPPKHFHIMMSYRCLERRTCMSYRGHVPLR